MKFHGLTESLIDGTTTIRVLRQIVHLPQRQFTGRELALESGTTPSKTIVALDRLRTQGLVTVRQAGRAHQWQLNPSHALVPPLRKWFEFERRTRDMLLEKIAQSLGPLPFVQKVVIFGSFARREERPNSDIDLFVLVTDGHDKDRASEALAPLRSWTYTTFGNPLRPFIYDVVELARKRNLAVVKNIGREGVLVLERPTIKTKKVDRSKSASYWVKAKEFEELMEKAAEVGKWNGVGLNAIHAVISAADAATVHCFGLRSREEDHEQVYELLRRVPHPDALAKASQAIEVVQRKNVVEYEARLFEETEGQAVAEKARRFLQWVEKILAKKT